MMVMSDDDESFVVLGSSPLPSLASDRQCSNGVSKEVSAPPARDSLSSGEVISMVSEATEHGSIKPVTSVPNGSNNCNGTKSANSSVEPDCVRSVDLADSSLAASFILGEIDADVLKNSLYSQFPSLCCMEAHPDDINKLQALMVEYVEMKNTLAKVNFTMKQFLDKAQHWKTEVEDCRTEIAMLRNGNLNLKLDIETKMDQMKLQDDLRQKEYDELRQAISEKTAQINNMRSEMSKLEQMQLASFEYIPKNQNDTKETPDYVIRSEHERIVKEFERKVSELLAQNLDFKDVQNQYVDEINCLKVNLTSAEELIKQSRADIDLLKANDMQKSQIFSTYETERDKMKEELLLLRQQVDVYAKDFQMERAAREDLAGEKDQLLQDLRALQRKNQELIEQAQKHLESVEKLRGSGQASGSNGKDGFVKVLPSASDASVPASNAYHCPICFKQCKSLNVLQEHVNLCLKD